MGDDVAETGRPSKYKPEYNEQGRKLCLMGYTDAQLGDFFGVSETTINNWKLEHDGFLESLNAGKVIADANVTASLYERAVGYQHQETKVFCSNGEIVEAEVKKIYPPDPISIKYWLNNRQKDTWREKVEHIDDQDKPVEPLNITFEVRQAKDEINITNAKS